MKRIIFGMMAALTVLCLVLGISGVAYADSGATTSATADGDTGDITGSDNASASGGGSALAYPTATSSTDSVFGILVLALHRMRQLTQLLPLPTMKSEANATTSDNNYGEDAAVTAIAVGQADDSATATATNILDGDSSIAVTDAYVSDTADISITADATNVGASIEGNLTGSQGPHLSLFTANVDSGDTQIETEGKDSGSSTSSSDNTSGGWGAGWGGYGGGSGYSGAGPSGGG